MKAVYLDLFSGISGDMFVGAFLDLGVDMGVLREGLARLPVTGYHLHADRRTKAGISGTKFDVHLDADPHPAHHAGPGHAHVHLPDSPASAEPGFDLPAGHRHQSHSHPRSVTHRGQHAQAVSGSRDAEVRDFRAIVAMISGSSLSAWVRDRAVGVFRRIAEAEGKIHGLPPEEVHFHEVGAVDSIVDVVGGCLAVEALGRPRVFAASPIDGTGWVRCAHGQFPVPAPATLEILAARRLTVSQCEEPHEMVTPTGAALLAELAEGFGPMPSMRLERIGYGLGTRELATRPNVLRAVWGELATASSPAAATTAHDWETDQIACLETNLDDASPELLGHFLDRALAAGALDVSYGAIQMKKSRPGVVLTVLCPVTEADRLTEFILMETTAFGVRRSVVERRKLRREFESVETSLGQITVKVGRLDGRVLQVAPEYESCRSAAAAAGVPVKTAFAAALHAFSSSPRAGKQAPSLGSGSTVSDP